MLRGFLWCFLLSSLLFTGGCSKKNNTLANNTQYNTLYKNADKVSPIRNVVHQYQADILLESTFQYYVEMYHQIKEEYRQNDEYFNFLQNNNDTTKIKNIAVETLPKQNYEYLQKIHNKDSVYELNRMDYQAIEYTMFLIDEMKNKKMNGGGDAIVYPYIYEKHLKNNAHIVFGDEYLKWNEWCTIGDIC